MGHQVVKCDYCGSYVMEGRNDWDCDCGAHCSSETNFTWKNSKAKENENTMPTKHIKSYLYTKAYTCEFNLNRLGTCHGGTPKCTYLKQVFFKAKDDCMVCKCYQQA